MRVACSWCRGSKFHVSLGPLTATLECTICHARTIRAHTGWVTIPKDGQADDWSGGRDNNGTVPVEGNGHEPKHLVSPQERRFTVVETDPKKTPDD